MMPIRLLRRPVSWGLTASAGVLALAWAVQVARSQFVTDDLTLQVPSAIISIESDRGGLTVLVMRQGAWRGYTADHKANSPQRGFWDGHAFDTGFLGIGYLHDVFFGLPVTGVSISQRVMTGVVVAALAAAVLMRRRRGPSSGFDVVTHADG